MALASKTRDAKNGIPYSSGQAHFRHRCGWYRFIALVSFTHCYDYSHPFGVQREGLLYLKKGWNVLCFGSANDHETGKKISNFDNLQEEDHFYNLIGKTSLVDAVDLLSHCKKAVSNDSGLMHIAAAVETPIVAVYGPSSPEYTPPLINKKVIIRKMEGYKKIREGNLPDGYDVSLLSISPEEVMEALETL